MTIKQIKYINDVLKCGVLSEAYGNNLCWKYNDKVYIFPRKALFNDELNIKHVEVRGKNDKTN